MVRAELKHVIVLFPLDAIKSHISSVRAKKILRNFAGERKFTENNVLKWAYLSRFIIISTGAAAVTRFTNRPKRLSSLELEELR